MSADLVIANLDAEFHWAQRAGQPVRPLSASVQTRISLYGTLLRALWPEAKRLWTPAPVDPRCVRPVPGLADVVWETGPLPDHDARSTNTWALAPPHVAPDADLRAAFVVNDKRATQTLAEQLGVAVPGSARVYDRDGLLAVARQHEQWIVKAPYATAGRDRIRGSRDVLGDDERRRLDRLFSMPGPVLFEPWLPRTRDVGRVFDAQHAPQGTHAAHNAPGGAFRGIEVGAPTAWPGRDLGRQVAAYLQKRGYHGPFGIDAFDTEHGPAVPLCEINARHTFGHVAHALYDRVARRVWGDDPGVVALRFGDEPQPDDPMIVPLLGSAQGERMFAWLKQA